MPQLAGARPVSQNRRNIINGTQGDLHMQPYFALVEKGKGKKKRKLCHYKVWGSEWIGCVGARVV